jgi:hypothetical protein
MEEAEYQRRDFGIRLHTKPALIGAKVVERLVRHRQADDRVNQIAADIGAEIHPQQHRRRVTQRE